MNIVNLYWKLKSRFCKVGHSTCKAIFQNYNTNVMNFMWSGATVSCEITFRFSNKLRLLYCETTPDIFHSVHIKFWGKFPYTILKNFFAVRSSKSKLSRWLLSSKARKTGFLICNKILLNDIKFMDQSNHVTKLYIYSFICKITFLIYKVSFWKFGKRNKRQ